jgi:hypothetical protein
VDKVCISVSLGTLTAVMCVCVCVCVCEALCFEQETRFLEDLGWKYLYILGLVLSEF